MIGKAIYHLLSTNADLLALHQGRVSPVMFNQGEDYPAIYYNTKGMTYRGCRTPGGSKIALLEIGAIAADSIGIETLYETLVIVLGDYQGIHEGYSLTIETNDDDFDESDMDIDAFYKRLLFDLTVTKL